MEMGIQMSSVGNGTWRTGVEINDEIQNICRNFRKNVVIFNKPTTYFTRLITPMMRIDVIGFSATSGVTRVSITGCGNEPSLGINTTHTLSPPPKWSFLQCLCKIQPHKLFTFIRMSLRGWCHPGRSPPPLPFRPPLSISPVTPLQLR